MSKRFYFILLLLPTIGIIALFAERRWDVAADYDYPMSSHKIYSCDSSTFLIVKKHIVPGPIPHSMFDSLGKHYNLTTDYGKTWKTIFSTVHASAEQLENDLDYCNAAHLFNKDTIYIYHTINEEQSIFCKTYNGGIDWDTVFYPVPYPHGRLVRNPCYFKNVNEGFIVPKTNIIMRTTDAGNTWETEVLPAVYDTVDSWGPDYSQVRDDLIYMLVEHAYEYFDTVAHRIKQTGEYYRAVVYSTDKGDTWEVYNDRYDSVFKEITLIDMKSPKEMWAATNNPDTSKMHTTYVNIRRTTDAGDTWETLRTGDGADTTIKGFPLHFAFFDDCTILVTNLQVWRTYDEGKTWIPDLWSDSTGGIAAFPPHQTIDRPHFATKNHGMVYDFVKRDLYKFAVVPSKVDDSKCQDIDTGILYPNPISPGDLLFFEIEIPNDSEIIIFDASGKTVLRKKISNRQVRLPEDINLGVNFVVIRSAGKTIVRQKIFLR